MKKANPILSAKTSGIERSLIAMAFFVLLFLSAAGASAQEQKQMVRLAKIRVDSLQLNQYTAALKKQMTTPIRLEPGVLTYYAVADKADPTRITILEIYADTAAYNLHVATPHFKAYRETVKNMVKSLELVDVNLVGLAKKPGL